MNWYVTKDSINFTQALNEIIKKGVTTILPILADDESDSLQIESTAAAFHTKISNNLHTDLNEQDFLSKIHVAEVAIERTNTIL